jgi:hypothetical protein
MPRDVSLLDQNARAFNAQVAAIVVGDAIAVGDFPISYPTGFDDGSRGRTGSVKVSRSFF